MSNPNPKPIVRTSMLREKQNVNEKLTTEHSRIGQILYFRFLELQYDYLVMEKKTGMGRSKIKRIFNGGQDWTLSDIIKICSALKIEVKDLF